MWNRAVRPLDANGSRTASELGALLRRICCGIGRRSAVAGALEHLGSLPLTTHASLALVRMGKETLLLGITPQNITLLSKIDDDAGLAPQGAVLQQSFSEAEGRAR